MQSEFLRERVRQAVEWGIEDAWPRYNRIYDPHDPDDESRQEWVDCITEQVVTALLRTPVAPVDEDVRTRLREKLEAWIAEDRPGVVRPPFPLYLDDARTVAALLRTPSGEGETQAQKVEAVLRRWNRLAADVEGSEGPLTETEIAAISRDVAAALRSEARGEDELCRENERLTKAWHAAHEARRRAEDEARLWFDRYQALRSESPDTPSGEGEADAESGGDVTVSQLLAVLDEYNAGVFCMTPENADGTPMFSVAVARGESAERLKQWANEDAEEPAALRSEAQGEEQIRFPCGCVTCVCDDDEQCHGCGARSCGDRPCDAVREHFAARRGEGGGE